MRFLLALWLGKLSLFAVKLIAKERGTNLPGALAMKIDPQLIAHLGNIKPQNTIFITGTNGKSTTTNLVARIFELAQKPLAVNIEGANVITGVATSLLRYASLAGNIKKDYILLETDERFLPLIAAQLKPGHICITNIQKDQVQRNGEPNIIYRKIKSVLDEDICLYLNNEEPISAHLSNFAGKTIFYSVAHHAASFEQNDFWSVTMPCPNCGHGLDFAYYNLANIGNFSCPNCQFASQEKPDYQIKAIDFNEQYFNYKNSKFHFNYAAPHFLYCYSAAIAIAKQFDIEEPLIAKALNTFKNIGGRMENIEFGSKTIKYLRMKQENPETLQSALNHIAADHKPKIFMLGLDELTDFEPFYTNTFYAYDCDFDSLIKSDIVHYICFSGTVCYDTALRLQYAGVDPEHITVITSNDDQTILNELAKHDCDNIYLITWLKKYEDLAAFVKKNALSSSAAAKVAEPQVANALDISEQAQPDADNSQDIND